MREKSNKGSFLIVAETYARARWQRLLLIRMLPALKYFNFTVFQGTELTTS